VSVDDGLLLSRAQQLDPDAWSVIYAQYYPRVYAFLMARVRDSMLAEDLAADVFVSALRAIASYEERGLTLAAWLYRIAHNRLIDYYRRYGSRPGTSLDEMEADGSPEPAAHPSGDAASNERIDLHQAMQRLSTEQQQVIHLRFVEGMTSDQVAQIMSKSEGAVKILQHRALKVLKGLLGRDIVTQ
jgi:RNA polymerase sigma-70 factor (ECF subfamily)